VLPIISKTDKEEFEKASLTNRETYDKAIVKSRRGWFVAGILGVILIFALFAIIALAPMKEKIPFVVEVDKITGETSVKKVQLGTLTQSESLTKYWLNKYVRMRTQYDYQDIENSYEIVRAMTLPKEFAIYARGFDKSNPENPLKLYADKVTLKTRIKSISFLDKDTATVRIDIEKKQLGDNKPMHYPYIVTLSFRFTLSPETEKEIQENPFGFQCTKWRIDSEIVTGEK